MTNYQVTVNFNDGTYDYDLLHVYSISDPEEGMKATVIQGNRADGSIVIPGGKKSQEIIIKGRIFDSDGYPDIATAIENMKTKVTTNVATLTLKYWTGTIWQNTWQKTVRRISEIRFPTSLRNDEQTFEVSFLVLVY